MERSNGDLKQMTLRGIRWSALAQVLSQISNFSVSIVLARLLGPHAFGLIGMVTVFTGLAGVLNDTGIGSALVQRKTVAKEHVDTAFWTSILVGALLAVLVFSVSGLIAAYYHMPELQPVASALAIRFLLDSSAVVPQSLLYRAMRFKTLAVIQISGAVTGSLVGLILALRGYGVWSLVMQTLSVAAVTALVAFAVGRWRVGFSFSGRALKELFSFGGYLLGFNIFNYWARNLDQLIIGKTLGAGALGLYSRSYSLMMLPLTHISGVHGRVMFPAFAAIQDERARLQTAYLRAIATISLITFPLMVGAFAVADDFIPIVLGPKWDGAVPIFKIFCWVGLLQSVSTSVGWIYISQGKTRLYFTMGCIASFSYAITFLIGVHWGVIGVAWSYLIMNCVLWYPFWLVPTRLIGLSFSKMIRALSPTFFSALGMGAGVMLIHYLVEKRNAITLCCEILSGVGLYFATISAFRVNAWEECKRNFGARLTSRSSRPRTCVEQPVAAVS
jgi:O-antigen/teichoic acid export membrane protein